MGRLDEIELQIFHKVEFSEQKGMCTYNPSHMDENLY